MKLAKDSSCQSPRQNNHFFKENIMQLPPRIAFGNLVCVATFMVVMLVGCSPNNNLSINTAIGTVVTGGKTSLAPLGSQHVTGQWVVDIPKTSSLNTNHDEPVGYNYTIDGVTSSFIQGEPLSPWPTSFSSHDDRMPAYWDFQWEHPDYCVNQIAPSYPLLPNPASYTDLVELPTSKWSFSGPAQPFICYVNSPANPDFVPTHVNPQFVFDDALPSTIQVSAFSPINAASSITNLRLFSMSLTNPANVTAESVASDGSSAIFPYPKSANGTALPAGPYITTITTDPAGEPQTTNGMEPIYIAHNDKSYTSAFGVDVAVPSETVTTIQFPGSQYGLCQSVPTVTTTQYGGSELPLVTLTSQGKLAVGSSSSTISVGQQPTVVIAYNSVPQYVQESGPCGTSYIASYSGAQSALVVNTGSNSVSLVNIGQYNYPSGTISVGTSPVAAVIAPGGNMAYIANYGSGTISEVSLQNVQATRTLSVGPHPTTVAFDTNGVLWVGGQGYMKLISRINWAVSSTFPLDGTVTGMSYDMSQGQFVATILKNGTSSSPSNGRTMSSAIAFSKSGAVSYSTTSQISVTNGNTTSNSIAADTSAYAQSSLAPYLAFPGQTAFTPPIYTSKDGDLIASANGNTFTVSVLSTGKVLVGGTTPYPIRGIALTSTMLYMTMPESNSLVTLPLQLP
jgi:hypothetical protein